MRGTPLRDKWKTLRTGIIPAYAGNTSQCAALRALLRDHPRICGEHPFRRRESVTPTESSPHMRGTLFAILTNCLSAGIIPAYAGNTVKFFYFGRVVWDHPRICGEHPPVAGTRLRKWGSSPHMRGTPPADWMVGLSLGIIPAYAGNTPRPHDTCPAARDHPRICGEHPGDFVGANGVWGSSPHMRGTLMAKHALQRLDGIIPAYAGNTWLLCGGSMVWGDHPRICGEHDTLTTSTPEFTGSSPHMRGTLQLNIQLCRVGGIIPAYAGNTV